MATITSLGFSIFARERASRVFRQIGDSAEEMATRATRAGRVIAEKFEALDETMTKAGAVAGAALGVALVQAVDASAATGKLRAQLDLTAKESARFGGMAGRLYSQAYGESVEDVHNAIGAVVSSIRGMRTASDDAVEGMARKALNLAKAFEIDTARSVQVVGQMVKTNLVDDATQGMDLLTAVLQKVPAAVREDVVDALDEYAPFMEQIGVKGQRAFELIVQAADKGAYGIDKMGDAFKEVTLKIASDSAAVDEALKELGLSQEGVQDAFAKGGAAGAKAFRQIVDGLLSVKDPGDRAKLAIELFGTPIEDLNVKDIPAFLKSLTQTSQKLGDTAGAADRMGQALQGTASAKIQSFKRSVEQNLVNVIANDVLPRLEQMGGAAKSVGLTPGDAANAILVLAGVAAGYKSIALAAKLATLQVGRLSIARGVTGAAGALAGVVTGFRNVNAAMATSATLSTRLGAALRSQIMLWRQQAAAAGVSTARIIAQAAAQKVVAAATRAWAAVQWLLNAAMSANPIGLIIIAIVAIVAAVVLAYRKFDWFRNLVDTVWSAIQTGAQAAWSFLQPIFQAIANVITNVLGTALRWYVAYVKFVFSTVMTVIQVAWSIIRPIFNTIATIVRAVLGVAFTVLMNTVKIVWIAIQVAIKIAWTLIRGYFNLMKAYISNVLAPIFRTLWSVVKLVWSGIQAAIRVAWNVIKGIWNTIRNFLSKTLGPAFTLFRSLAGKAWEALKGAISRVWNTGIRPVFDRVKSVVASIPGAFRKAVDAIKGIWDRLKGIAKTPVNFVIGLYNDGIVNLVNKIASFAGVKTRLGKIKKFKSGGIMPGYAPNGGDPLVARVNPGEAIMRPEFTRGVGARTIHLWNQLARSGGPRAIREWFSRGGGPLGGEGATYSRGGIVGGFAGRFRFGGIVGGFMKGLKDFAFKGPEKMFKSALGKMAGSIPGAGVFRDAVAGIPTKLIDTLVHWFKDKVGMGGGPGYKRAMTFAQAQAGKPYVWGGVGPGGYDCSGFMSAIHNVIEGKNPYSRRYTTFGFTGAQSGPGGFVRNKRSGFEVGVTNAGVGHMAGTLLGKNVESSGSVGVRVGGGARGAGDAMFPMRYGLSRDRGGRIPPGEWLVSNKTGRDEWMFTEGQLKQLMEGGGDTYVTNVYPQRADWNVNDLNALNRRRETLARVRRAG